MTSPAGAADGTRLEGADRGALSGPPPLPLLPWLGAVVTALVTVISCLPHSNWYWGVNLLHFYPLPVRLAWGLAGTAALVVMGARQRRAPPAAGRKPGTEAEAGPAPPAAGRKPGSSAAFAALLTALGSAAVAGLLFHMFRARTGLLGDGMQIMMALFQKAPPAARSPLYSLLEPPLVTAFTHGTRAATVSEAGALSILAGSVTIFLAVLLLRAGAGRSQSPAAVALVLTQASLQLFFGYVESYALLAAALILFCLAAEGYRSGAIGAWVLIGAAVMAVLSHPFGLAALPGLAAALAIPRAAAGEAGPGRRGTPRAIRRLAITGAVMAAAAAGLWTVFSLWPAGMAYASPWRQLAPQSWWLGFVGLLGDPGGAAGGHRFDSILSPVQAADVLNQLFLTAGPALVVLIALGASPAARRALRSPAIIPPLAVFIPLFLLRALLRTWLGAPRDWDLFSGAGIALTAVAAAALNVHRETEGRPAPAAPILVIGLFLIVPWIGVQAGSERSVERHLALVDARPQPEPFVAATYHAAMGDRLSLIGQPELAGRAYAMAFHLSPEWKYAWKAGLAYSACGQIERAVGAMTEAARRNPLDWRPWSEEGRLLAGLNAFDRAEDALRRAIQLNPGVAEPRIHLARVLSGLGRDREARLMLESARLLLDPKARQPDDFRLLDQSLPVIPPSPPR